MRADRAHWEKRYAGAEDGAQSAPTSPPPFLVENADRIRGRVLDIACGKGRNAVFLARRGNTVEGIDIAFGGLAEVQRFALVENLPIRLIQADLDDFPLPVARYDAVINFRFLNRRLLPSLALALKPGGVLVFETFLIDQRELGHPRNPDFLLRHGELRDAFRSLEHLKYEEGPFDLPDGRAYLARLVGRRRD